VERTLHWVNATLLTVVMASALSLYFGPLSAIVGRRETMKAIHVYCGLALPVPFVLALVLGRRSCFRDDVRRLNRWIADDKRWLKTLGRDPYIRLGKFHPGQKVNAAYLAGAIPVMLATGSIMRWFRPFPLSWRSGATFVHDWTAFGLFILVTGHVLKAISDQEAMKGMLGGSVDRGWAKRHHPRWHDEIVAATEPTEDAAAHTEPTEVSTPARP
jgi:formate dehydrogenase subunit gamma